MIDNLGIMGFDFHRNTVLVFVQDNSYVPVLGFPGIYLEHRKQTLVLYTPFVCACLLFLIEKIIINLYNNKLQVYKKKEDLNHTLASNAKFTE
jgi:hypothetical protein